MLRRPGSGRLLAVAATVSVCNAASCKATFPTGGEADADPKAAISTRAKPIVPTCGDAGHKAISFTVITGSETIPSSSDSDSATGSETISPLSSGSNAI
ncbi:hypothetical protein ABZP36_007551 [Zizania latifolia]